MKIGAIADPPEKLGRLETATRARELEDAGVDSLWAGIHVRSEGFVTAGFLSGVTSKPKIAVGVVNPYTRHPLASARSVSSLDMLSDHRVILILGFGWPPWVKNTFSLPVQDRIGDMRAFVTALRELFRGKRVTIEAAGFKMKEAKISKPIGEIPIYIAAEKKGTLQLTRSIADGVLVGGYPPPRYIRWITDNLRGLEGIYSKFEVCAHIEIRLTSDIAKARERFKSDLAYYIAGEDDSMIERYGFDLDLTSRVKKTLGVKDNIVTTPENLREAASQLPDRYVDESCLIGPIEVCIERLAEYEKSGLTTAVLSFQDDYDSVVPNLMPLVEALKKG